MKRGLFKITGLVLGLERMLVVVTPAKPQSPFKDLGYLAQDALDTGCSLGGSALSDALSKAGFGVTTRGAIALTDETGGTGPSQVILDLELRMVAGD